MYVFDPVILKAVYEIYYAPEVKKLVARVVGKTKICGIYRITSRVDGRIYIGKSVDIAARWQTHFKRAAGVDGNDKFALPCYEAGRTRSIFF